MSGSKSVGQPAFDPPRIEYIRHKVARSPQLPVFYRVEPIREAVFNILYGADGEAILLLDE